MKARKNYEREEELRKGGRTTKGRKNYESEEAIRQNKLIEVR